jgi:hypothetical protein
MSVHADPGERDVELALESVLLHSGDHVGVFYRGAEERDAFVIPAIDEALAAGCGVIYVCDRETPEQVRKLLLAEAIDVDGAVRRGQMQLVSSTDAYLADGSFDPDRTVEYYRRACQRCRGRGHHSICIIGEMSWSLRECPGTERLLEYEALYARQSATADAIALCLYDLEQTRGEQIFDLLRFHGRVLLNGIEMQNPHCVDPGFFLPGGVRRR